MNRNKVFASTLSLLTMGAMAIPIAFAEERSVQVNSEVKVVEVAAPVNVVVKIAPTTASEVKVGGTLGNVKVNIDTRRQDGEGRADIKIEGRGEVRDGKNDREESNKDGGRKDGERKDNKDAKKADDKYATSTEQKKENRGRGDEHRSMVADFVQKLREVGERHKEIGDSVKELADEQASTSVEVSDAADKVEARGSFRTFLFGSDYKNLGKIRSAISKTNNRLDRLNRELEKMASSTDKIAVQIQIDALTTEQVKLDAFIKTNEDKFSLLGWFFRRFQR